MNWQLARYLTGTGLAIFADRVSQIALLSLIVMSGPDGQGLGSNTLALLMPSVLMAYALGTLVDKHDLRKFLIALSLVRGIFVLGLPTILTTFGAAGPVIPLSLALLSVFVATSAIANFAVIPKLASKSSNLRSANSLSALVSTGTTLAAVWVASNVAYSWLPHETLRLAAALYFFSMVIFWSIDRTKTRATTASANDTKELANFLQKREGAISLFRLGFFAHAGHLIFYTIFLVFCLQNTQLNNAQSLILYTVIASGYCVGSLLSLIFFNSFRASSLIAYSTLIAAVNCIVFSAFGSSFFALRIFLFIMGTAGATTIIAIDSLLQKRTRDSMRGKIYGAIACLSAGAYLIGAIGVEQITTQYAAVTIVRATAGGWLAFAALVGLGSGALRRRVFASHKKREPNPPSSTASAAGKK